MGGLYLTLSILFEVMATTMMKLTATVKSRLPILGIVIGYTVAFYALSLTLLTIPLSFAYAVWSGVGTALTALVGFFIFKEKIKKETIIGIGLIIVGLIFMRL